MNKNEDLQLLFDNYANLSEEQLDRLLALVVKQEKENLGLSLPVTLDIDYWELAERNAGGDSNLIYNDEKNRYEYSIRINGNEWYKQYLANRNKTSKLGEMTFDNSLDSLYNLVARVCHEMRHAYQNEMTQVRTEIDDPNAILWLKQSMVINDENFYRNTNNYANMPREVDAFNYQYQQALGYIKEYTTVEKDNPEFFKTLEQTLQRNQKENVKPVDELMFEVNGEKVKATEYFAEHSEEAIKNDPNITPEVIEKSILRYEFNDDGKPKNFEQLMQDKKKKIEVLNPNSQDYDEKVKKVEEIYSTIIKNNQKTKNSFDYNHKSFRETLKLQVSSEMKPEAERILQ